MTKIDAERFVEAARRALLPTATRADLEALLEVAVEDIERVHEIQRPELSVFERFILPRYQRPDEPELSPAEAQELELERASRVQDRARAKKMLAAKLRDEPVQTHEVEVTPSGGLLVREAV